MEMLRVKLMYDNQPHDKHCFQMEYKMHENYRNKDEKLTLTLKTDEIQKTLIKETYKHVLRRPASTMKTDY